MIRGRTLGHGGEGLSRELNKQIRKKESEFRICHIQKAFKPDDHDVSQARPFYASAALVSALLTLRKKKRGKKGLGQLEREQYFTLEESLQF